MIKYDDLVLFFASKRYQILGEIFDDIESWAKENKLSYGYYKDDQFLNSLFIVVPQTDRTLLVLCPQGSGRHHTLHFSPQRLDVFLQAFHQENLTRSSR